MINFAKEAYSLGKLRLSPQTGLIHLFHQEEEGNHHTIPLFENLTFALALFRTKEIDNIELAQKILERCLSFQTKEGSFPMYLHEYPLDHSYLNAIDILNTLYWIGKEFTKILPTELKKKCNKAQSRLISFGEKKKKYFPPSSLFRFEILKNSIGKKNLNFSRKFNKSFLYSKEGLKDIFLSLQVYDLENKKEFSRSIWKEALKLFHRPLLSYAGAFDNIFQSKYSQKLHLSDLFFYSLLKEEQKFDASDPEILAASLIRPILNVDLSQDEMSAFFKFEKEEMRWLSLKEKSFYLVSLEKAKNVDKAKAGMHLFYLLLGNRNFASSFTCQHFEGEFFSQIFHKGFEMEFILPEEIKEDQFEIKLFVENNCQILVNGQKATSFTFNDEITLKNNGVTVTFYFEKEGEKERFSGHILRGNRPSQVASKKDRSIAYDYLIGLRTVHRSSRMKIKLKANIYEG
jgi:hypothetical protein